MVKGIKHWNGINGVSIRYDQLKRAADEMLRKFAIENRVDNSGYGYLESCSANSLATIMEGQGRSQPITFPTGVTISLADAIMDDMNSPVNDGIYNKGDSFDNRAIKNIIIAAKRLFNCRAYKEKFSFTGISLLLSSGAGVAVCIDNPGHYIPLIAYDDETDKIIFHDPVGERRKGIPVLKNDGRYERMSRYDVSNIREDCIVFPRID